jgi:molecular chaperone GrpE
MNDQKQETGIKKQECEKCEKCEEYLTGWKRALADYDNLKKDVDARAVSSRTDGKIEMALLLIESLDSLDTAVANRPETDDIAMQAWIDGIEHTRSQIEGCLEQEGFFRMHDGGAFNPIKHHAVARRKEEGIASDMILKTMQYGWYLQDRVIRPAMVVVSE